MSDGGGVQDQVQREEDKKAKQVLKALNKEIAYHDIDFLGLQQLTQVLAPSPKAGRVLEAACALIRNTSEHIQSCWLCLSLVHNAYIETPVPIYRDLDQETGNSMAQNSTELIGLIAFNIQHPPTKDSITCLTSFETGNISYGSVPAQLCSSNHTTNHLETYCAPSGVFLLCRNTAFRCLQVNWTGLCMPIFRTPDISVQSN